MGGRGPLYRVSKDLVTSKELVFGWGAHCAALLSLAFAACWWQIRVGRCHLAGLDAGSVQGLSECCLCLCQWVSLLPGLTGWAICRLKAFVCMR